MPRPSQKLFDVLSRGIPNTNSSEQSVHATYPGLEGFYEFAFGGDIVQDVIKLKLTQALGTVHPYKLTEEIGECHVYSMLTCNIRGRNRVTLGGDFFDPS